MDNCILELNKITQDIIIRLDNCSYEELNDFVEQRQILIDQLEQQVKKQSIGVIEQHQLRELLEADPKIIARMQQLKSEAAMASTARNSQNPTQRLRGRLHPRQFSYGSQKIIYQCFTIGVDGY